MIHRLGMHYLAVQLQHDQDVEAARQKRGESLDRRAVTEPVEFAMLMRAGAAVAAAIGAVALLFWAAA